MCGQSGNWFIPLVGGSVGAQPLVVGPPRESEPAVRRAVRSIWVFWCMRPDTLMGSRKYSFLGEEAEGLSVV